MPNTPPRPVIESALLNGVSAATQWTNLGFWKNGGGYVEAAAELARRVGRAAALGPGDVVLDVACGHGDSCVMWVREFDVARVIGLEPDPILVAANTSRVTAMGLGDRITFRCAHAEAIDTVPVPPDVSAVTCVDAAYLFDSRDVWLDRLAFVVGPGTRLAMSDLLVAPRAQRSPRVIRLATRAGIPTANLWTAHDVEPGLSDAGFALERMVRCGPEVLGGFTRHALKQSATLLAQRGFGGWRALGTAAAIAMARARLDYAILAALRT